MTGWGNICGLPRTPATRMRPLLRTMVSSQHHPGKNPDLNTILRKVYEAMLIYEYKQSINDKEECKLLERFLVRSCNNVE